MSTVNSLAIRILLGLAVCSISPTLLAEPSDAATLPEQGTAVTTFHSIGLYWTPAGTPAGGVVKIQYAKTTDTTWKVGHDLWYDSRTIAGRSPEARGSIVMLEPATSYVVKFGTLVNANDPNTIQWVAKIHATTWSENFPVGSRADDKTWSGLNPRTTNSQYPSGSWAGRTRSQVLLVDRPGTPTGYTLYDFTGLNAVAQVSNAASNFCVVIAADYVIVRGLKCIFTDTGVAQDPSYGGHAGIWIDPGHHNIVIEDCDISQFGRKGTGSYQLTDISGSQTYTTAVNEDSAIAIQPNPGSFGAALTSNVIVQRCKIHNPMYGANPWDYGHPVGASGILMYPSGGNHVIRYNEVYSTRALGDGSDSGYTGPQDPAHYFLDALVTGGENFDYVGSPGPNSDIYGNVIMSAMDDGLEAEGGGMNVRVWQNYIDYTATGPASTSVSVGPLYLFRNVYNRSREYYSQPWGQESDRTGFFKAGSDSTFGGGRRYVYHNTALQTTNPNFQNGDCTDSSNATHCPLGADYGISDTAANNVVQPITNTVSRNNIFETWKWWHTVINAGGGGGNDFDYDMTNTDASHLGVTEPNGKVSSPAQYASGNGPVAQWTGKYQLQPNSPGYDDGFIIANFSDGYVGAKPDRGAHEAGSPDMVFGLAAALGAPHLASDTGVSNTDNITSSNPPTFTGSAAAGSTVQIYDGTTLIGSGTATNGTYSITTSVLGDGSHSITAKVGSVQSSVVTVTIDTQAPSSAAITAPANGSSVSGMTTITATTDASGVYGVQFKLDGASLQSEDTSSPYSINWDTTTAANGSHTLTAVARDTAGNSVTSAAVSVTVSNVGGGLAPPSAPDLDAASDSGTSNADNITNVTLPKFTGTAAAGTTVNIYSDGAQVGSGPITGGAYSITLTTALTEGAHNITAKATDGTNTSAASGALPVTVDLTPPATSITAPASGATVAGTVAVSANASDGNGVVGVQFKLDGAALQSEDTTSPYSINWDTTSATNGSHTLTAVGRDVAGNIVTSAAVTVTVNNTTNPELNVSVTPQNTTVLSNASGEHLDITVSSSQTITSVNFYVNDVLKSTVTAPPYTYSFVTAGQAAGNYTIKVEASDGTTTRVETRPLTVIATTCEIYVNPASAPQGTAVQLQGVCTASKNIAEIRFAVDNIVQGSDPSSTYTATLETSGLAVGTRTITASGQFISPAAQASISRTLDVTTPTLSLDLAPGAVVLYDENITFTATVNDGRQLKQVDFYLDGNFKAGVIAAPYVYTWTPGGIADLGRHTMVVNATDTSGNVVSTTRNVLLTPRGCSLELGTPHYRQAASDTVYAGSHKIVQGQRVSVRSECTAWASINRVEFYLNGVLQATTTDAPYAVSLDTSALTVGQTYTVSTKGYFTNGVISNDSLAIDIVAP